MTTARRRWLSAAVGVLAVVVLVVAWTMFQAERRTSAAQPVPTSTGASEPGGGDASGGAGGSSSAVGASDGGDDQTGTDQGVVGGGLAADPDALGSAAPVPEGGSPASADGSPIAPWWQRVPPVAGTLLPINRYAAGTVRVENVPGAGLVVAFHDLHVATIGTPPRTLRVLLSAQPVIGERRGFWADSGSPVVVGDIPADVPTQSLVLTNPRVLPPEVRSLVLYDAVTGELLGGASLIPTD